MSCDKYSDLWSPFVTCFERYWSDCPASVYLVTETLNCESDVFERVIRCGEGTEWTDRLDIALKQTTTDFCILLCDDYLLCDKVDNELIQSLINITAENNAGNLRMLPDPSPNGALIGGTNVGEIIKGTPYRIATQAGIWSKEYLLQFANMHTSIWGFERLGSVMSCEFEQKILATIQHSFPFVDAVHKGKWERNGISLCGRNNVSVDTKRRQVMTNVDYIIKHGKGAIIDQFPNGVTRLKNAQTKIRKRVKRNL
jgi:hypothetical protein